MSEPSTPQVVIADVRLPKKYRAMMIVAVLFFSIAAVMGAGIAIGPARQAARQSAARTTADRVANHETDCRAVIAAVQQDALGDVVVQQTNWILTLSDPAATPEAKTAARDLYRAANTRVTAINVLRGRAVELCHADPNYTLPPELVTPNGGPPP